MGELEANTTTREEEDAEAKVLIWKYIFGHVETFVVKCAVQLGIAETIDTHGRPMSLPEPSDVLGCSSDPLGRMMRFLAHQKFFKEIRTSDGTKNYALTSLSRLLMRHEERNMRSIFLLHTSPPMLATWNYLNNTLRGNEPPPFVAANGEDLWSYTAGHPEHSTFFNESMACDSRIAVPAMVDSCAEFFSGVDTIVDVGGGNGTTLSAIIKAFPQIKGINFDLPHVVSETSKHSGLDYVGGDMFDAIPEADIVILKWILHDYDDEKCIHILKNSREAVLNGSNPKVIILDAVIKEDEDYKLKHVELMLDMVMMAHTSTGKERTREEWELILGKAGFSQFTVKPIQAVQSVIIAYP